jgi:hypothetical protein
MRTGPPCKGGGPLVWALERARGPVTCVLGQCLPQLLTSSFRDLGGAHRHGAACRLPVPDWRRRDESDERQQLCGKPKRTRWSWSPSIGRRSQQRRHSHSGGSASTPSGSMTAVSLNTVVPPQLGQRGPMLGRGLSLWRRSSRISPLVVASRRAARAKATDLRAVGEASHSRLAVCRPRRATSTSTFYVARKRVVNRSDRLGVANLGDASADGLSRAVRSPCKTAARTHLIPIAGVVHHCKSTAGRVPGSDFSFEISHRGQRRMRLRACGCPRHVCASAHSSENSGAGR